MQTELPKLLTVDETAAILGRHRRTVLNLARSGELARVVLGPRSVRFRPEDIADYIDRHVVGAA